MAQERLLAGMSELPIIEAGRVAKDNEIIEGNQGNVHYKMTKEIIPFLENLTLYSLSTSGPIAERMAFIQALTEHLGQPWAMMDSPNLPGIILFAFWEADQVDKRFKNETKK